ncbi:MAG: MCE family protein [Burkholderiales bacterium]|nr:MCE family protein [Burkholderiales bacterium]
MENRSHALVAGLFTVLLAIGIVAAAMWLNRDTEERTPYVLTTTGSVAGLNPQAAVRYRGMQVGKVEAITFDADEPGRILVKIGVLPSTPITTATFAELGMQGLTGLAYVQLDSDPRVRNPALVPSSAETPARLAIRPGLFDRFSNSGEDLLVRAATAVDQVNKLLGDENQKLLVQALASLKAESARIGQLADDARPVAAAVTRLAQDGSRILADARPLIAGTGEAVAAAGKLSTELTQRLGALDRAGRAAEEVGQSAGQIARSVAAMETELVPRLAHAIDNLDRTARTVERVTDRLGEEPTGVLFGLQPPRPGPGEPGFVAPTGGAR